MDIISLSLARIHAHLCGDGYSYISKTNQKGRKFIAMTGYCNNNFRLLSIFRTDFKEIFGVKMRLKRNNEVFVKSIRIFKELASKFGQFGSRAWKIPSSIKSSNKKIKLEWLKAFFEDEAYHEKRYNRLKTKSINLKGLKDVKEILDSINIKSNITGPNCDSTHYITIPKFNSYKEFGNFCKEPIRKNSGSRI